VKILNTKDEIKEAALKELRRIFENPENQKSIELGKAMHASITKIIEFIEKKLANYAGGEEDYKEETLFANVLKDDICKRFHLDWDL
jgi:hypothetical protein